MNNTTVLFWTCGWDSTYRLLELLLIKKVKTQPIYIIDRQRRSVAIELETIALIEKKILEKYPETADLLLPTHFAEKDAIQIYPETTEAFEYVKTIRRIGSQYEWLSAYCRQHQLKNVELCIEKNLKPDSFSRFLYKYQSLKDSIDENNPKELAIKKAVNIVFDDFSLPLIDVLKTEMDENSKQNDWLEIMYLTWFCHKPKRKKPCGKCVPCMLTIAKGMGHRIPFNNRLKGHLKMYKIKLKSILRAR